MLKKGGLMEDWNTMETPEESETMNSRYATNHDHTHILHQYGSGSTKTENVSIDPGTIIKTPQIEAQDEIGSVAREALAVINGGRKDCYGRPENTFEAIADLDDAFFYHAGIGPSPQWRVAMHNVIQKLGRITANPYDRDGYRDLIGYVAIACDMAEAADVEKGDRHDPE